MAFGIDLPGRINNIKLSKTHALHPLFEAVVNSIQAISEAKSKKESKLGSRITIEILRYQGQKMIKDEGVSVASRPIIGFTIEDDGVGFTDENYRSFQKSDTTRKAKKGGKGVGRFLWLKAFEIVTIESVYREKGKWWRRGFNFLCTDDGIENHKVQELGDGERRTVVRLEGMKSPYREHCPKNARPISKQIIEHCMPFFVLGSCPQIVVHDSDESSEIELGTVFNDEIKLTEKSSVIGIAGRPVRITHLLTSSSEEADHRLYYCAHQRSVKSEALRHRVPNLQKGLLSEVYQGPIYYTGLVTGDYLDDRVSTERTKFDLADDIFSDSPDAVQWRDFVSACIASAKEFLEPYLTPIQRKKEEKIEALVRERSPQYRALLRNRREVLEEIPPDLDDDELDIKLYEKFVWYESELKHQASRMLSEDQQGYEEIRKYFAQFIEQWNEQGLSKLAQYIVHRKSTLELFAQRLRVREDKRYPLEDAIHKLIFPMRATSDDVSHDSMNLWMIDERLAYHSYLASDKKLNQLENCTINDEDRPDLLIFNSPFAFTDSEPFYNSIVIIEFKRPMRKNYTPTPDEEGNEEAKKNPISQVQRYIDKIRDGTALDRNGRPILACKNARFFAYIICDLTPSLRQIATESDMQKTPDEQGYFKYFANYNAYMEIVSFDQLLDNARKRNKMFFEKLNLPDRKA